MNKKLVVLEFIIILGALIYYMVTTLIPEYRKEVGSSDSFVNASQVENIIEIRIDNGTDFALAIDKNEEICHIFFFDKNSVTLYNKSIESQSLENGIKNISSILVSNNLLQNESMVEIIRTNEKKYKMFQTSWNQSLKDKSITPNITEKKQDIRKKANQLGIEEESNTTMLLELDLYSKEIIKSYEKDYEILDEKKAGDYADAIYQKLEKMVKNNKKDEIPITLIPADDNHKYYPTNQSWYKIENEKVYAFIEIKEEKISYSYCYRGSIRERVKGKCQE